MRKEKTTFRVTAGQPSGNQRVDGNAGGMDNICFDVIDLGFQGFWRDKTIDNGLRRVAVATLEALTPCAYGVS